MSASIQISIEGDEATQELLISNLSDLGAEGFEQTEDRLIAYFPEHSFKSYEVNEALTGYAYTTATVAEQNWNAVWESNFQPVVIGKFCAVRADFHEPIEGLQHEIVITPKMSFGTGHHATTHMMIEQMEGIDFRGKTVFDFGTGTGILAILAEKLGAASITAIDVDDWSIENTKENMVRNGCNRISVSRSAQLAAEQFDIVLANINRNVILQYLPQLQACLKGESLVLLSGLLVNDEEDILLACKNEGMQFVKRSERSNWISLLFVKQL